MMNKVFLILYCGLMLLAGCRPSVPRTPELEEIKTHLEVHGFDSKIAQAVTDGLSKAQKEDSIDPIIDLLNAEDDIAFITASLLTMTPSGSRLLLKALEEDVRNPAVTIYACVYASDKGIVDYLVKRLQEEEDGNTKQAIVSTLRVICEQDIADDPKQWAEWWEKSRDSLELGKEVDVEKRERAFNVECQHLKVRQLKGVLDDVASELKEQGDVAGNVMDSIGNMLEGLADIADAGKELEYSEVARSAYQHWLDGDLNGAVELFGQAVEDDPDDRFSLYMQGVLLIETGRLSEAKKVFEKIIAAEKKCELAKFLKRYCQYHEGKDDSKILSSMFNALEGAELEGGNMWSWNDRFIISFLGQGNLGEGAYKVPEEKLRKMADASDNPSKVVAIALVLGERGETVRFLEARESKYKDSVIYQTALLRLYVSQSLAPERILSKIDLLCRLDPGNGYYFLLNAYYSDYKAAQEEDEDLMPPPLKDRQVEMVQAALDAEGFNSYSVHFPEACIDVLQEAGVPFAALGGFGAGMKLMPNYVIYRNVARRLKMRSMATENDAEAQKFLDMLMRLGDKIGSDDKLLINQLVAEAIRGIGRDVIIKRAEDSGDAATARKYKKLSADAKTTKKKYMGGSDLLVALNLLPVPKLQERVIEEVLKDEAGFMMRLTEFKKQTRGEP